MDHFLGCRKLGNTVRDQGGRKKKREKRGGKGGKGRGKKGKREKKKKKKMKKGKEVKNSWTVCDIQRKHMVT